MLIFQQLSDFIENSYYKCNKYRNEKKIKLITYY